MSKSLGNVADPFEAMEQFGSDVVRYYLARVGGRFKDDVGGLRALTIPRTPAESVIDWSREQLDNHNREIQSLLGNFLLRISSQKIRARFPDGPIDLLSACAQINHIPSLQGVLKATGLLPAKIQAEIETRMNVSDAIEHIVDVLKLANKTITDLAPWSKTTAAEDARACYAASVECLRVVGITLQPFLPGVAGKLLDALGVGESDRNWNDAVPFKYRDTTSEVKGVRLFEARPAVRL